MLIVAGKEEGSSKGPGSSHLSVLLLDVADVDDNLLDGDAGPELEAVVLGEGEGYLSVLSEQIDEVVGVGGES